METDFFFNLKEYFTLKNAEKKRTVRLFSPIVKKVFIIIIIMMDRGEIMYSVVMCKHQYMRPAPSMKHLKMNSTLLIKESITCCHLKKLFLVNYIVLK